MKKEKRTASLRWQILMIVLVCWLVPVVLVLTMMGTYFIDAVGDRAERNLSEQFQVQLRMCGDRVNSAVEASRLASYDTTIRDAWKTYREDGNYASLYRQTMRFLTRQYQTDSRFRYSVFWFQEDPEDMQLLVINSTQGEMYQEISQWWSSDLAAARELAGTLDTSVGFLEREGRLYLVRNLLNTDYEVIGVLALAMNPAYYFDDLAALLWASPVEVSLGETVRLTVRGEGALPPEGNILTGQVSGSGYVLSARAALDYGVLLSQMENYQLMLAVMLVLLLPLLALTVVFFRRKVSQPVAMLLEGARQIENGQLGYQVDFQADTREFRFLTDSFNRMSGQLKAQFERLYREELALRDAQIKALQAHINPHFLNNTLEIINWEARMAGDEGASRMIESLSTVMDAALDRKKSPEVPLAEEMRYVDAYLYIIAQRFGSRLTITKDIPEALLDCLVPRLILQPVIENAVEHGIRPNGHGEVGLRAYPRGDYLILEVSNNGALPPEDEARIRRLLSPNYDANSESSGNIGIANVNQRLRILYGPPCGLEISRAGDGRVAARLTVARRRAGGGGTDLAAMRYNK